MLLARKVTHIFIVSVLIGLLSAPVGLFLAFLFDLPSSPAIVGVASVVLGIAWIVNVARRR
jgi:ABC-type Mn2+/Zn2+ transport system permease subunit